MNEVYKHIKIVFYLILLFSGMMKWGLLEALDLTIIFGVLCILIMFGEILLNPNKLVAIWKWPTLFLLTLLLLTILSLGYTSSQAYCYKKTLQFVLAIAAFLYPQIVLSPNDYEKIVSYVKLFLLTGIGILLFLFYTFNYSFTPLILLSGGKHTTIPSYLVLSGFIVISFFYLLNRNSWSDIMLKLAALFTLFQLGGRGPIIILIAILLIDYVILNVRIKRIIILLSAILLVVGSILFLNIDLSTNRSLNRLQSLNSGSDNSVNERIILINKSLDIIERETWLGTGIGSYGIEARDKDVKLYPHNLFLEVAAEIGILGLIISLFFFAAVTWLAYSYFRNNKNAFIQFKGACYVAFFLFLENLKSNSFFENKLLFGAFGILLLLTQYSKENKPALTNDYA